MKNAMIKDYVQAFGPGAHIEAAATWRCEADGCAFAAYSLCIMIVDGTGRVVAYAVDDNAPGDLLFVGYDEENNWWCGEGGRAADKCCRELEQADWGDTPAEWFEATEGGLLPWEDSLSDEYVGGTMSLNKGRRW